MLRSINSCEQILREFRREFYFGKNILAGHYLKEIDFSSFCMSFFCQNKSQSLTQFKDTVLTQLRSVPGALIFYDLTGGRREGSLDREAHYLFLKYTMYMNHEYITKKNEKRINYNKKCR